ncbi:MAG TPA: hypothetical protein PKW95_03505 [bacterium]|nr:hypothetical protein [bacterium]
MLAEEALFPAANRESGELFQSLRPYRLSVAQIVLAKGSVSTRERRRFVESICALCPQAPVEEKLDTPHNKIQIPGTSSDGAKHAAGKKTLVFGEHKSAVRFSREDGNTCPNYWHFSPTGFCFFNCTYCYLAGTPGVWHSPTIRIFVNLDEIIERIDAVACGQGKPTGFYLGKLQDGLALDPLTGYSEKLVPFFARHPFARQVILTKSDEVAHLLHFDHNKHTILSWSLNPQIVIDQFEANTPSLNQRLEAMKRCVAVGYPIRAVVMPMIPVANWPDVYAGFMNRLLRVVPIRRLTIGGICSYGKALWLMEQKLGKENSISRNLRRDRKADDGRVRYPPSLRIAMYSHTIKIAREIRPDLEIALCLEEKPLWRELGLEAQLGKCNCVW